MDNIYDITKAIKGSKIFLEEDGMGAETDQQCEEMLARLGKETEISHRNNIPLKISKII